MLIGSRAGGPGATVYLGFVGIAFLLAAAFLAIGVLVSVVARNRMQAFGAALCVWFFCVIFMDVLVIGLSFAMTERSANLFLFSALFANPAQLTRISTLMLLGGSSLFGPTGAALVKFLGGPVLARIALVAAMVGWIAWPLAAASWLLRKQDL